MHVIFSCVKWLVLFVICESSDTIQSLSRVCLEEKNSTLFYTIVTSLKIFLNFTNILEIVKRFLFCFFFACKFDEF